MTDTYQLNIEEQSHHSIPNYSCEQLQQIAQDLSTLNHRLSGNSNNYFNTTGLFTVFAISINSTTSHLWIFDSGATDHIISKTFVMTEPKSPIMSTLNLVNGGKTHVSPISNVSFNPDLKLNNILCVLSLNLNLMFINKLTNDLKCFVTFYPNSCVMQDLTMGKMIRSGKKFGGLYHISLSPIKPSANEVSQSSDLWHLGLGHPSFSLFKFLADQLHLDNATFSHNGSICPLAK